MIHNKDFFELIEDYCLGQLEEEIKLEFEAELKRNKKLRNELKLWMEVQSAIEEKEVLNLRNKLQNVVNLNKSSTSIHESFELIDQFTEIQEISEVLSREELIANFDSLPKVHVYHHEATSNENVHQFYKEQNNSGFFDVEDDLNDFDFEELEGLAEAILEKDVLQLRQTLKQVAKSVEPQFSVEEIDNYLSGELTGSELFEFESNMLQNRSLKEEVRLHQNINKAIQESDIINLRDQISGILQTETSWSVSDNDIEDYIDGVLEGELLEEFNLELKDNSDLMAEIELRKQINEALREKDIFNLRNELISARKTSEVKKVKMLIPETKSGQIKFWRSSVAVIIVILGLAGVLGNSLMSVDKTYKNYYESPVWSPERSISENISVFQNANISYLNGNYAEVVSLLDGLQKTGNQAPVFEFYKAASLQNLNKFDEAIAGFTKVINQGDNLFIEEAEWYRSLCYLKIGDYEKAKAELLAVIERKGHFEKDAKAVMLRLKYSIK